MKKKEYKIGEKIQFGFKVLTPVESLNPDLCKNCFIRAYLPGDCLWLTRNVIGECGSLSRSDRKNVVFIEVKEEKPEWPLEGMEMELQPCPVRLIDCVYHDKKGLVQQCLVTYPANGWVLNKELVTELVRERKNDFKELVTFQIR